MFGSFQTFFGVACGQFPFPPFAQGVDSIYPGSTLALTVTRHENPQLSRACAQVQWRSTQAIHKVVHRMIAQPTSCPPARRQRTGPAPPGRHAPPGAQGFTESDALRTRRDRNVRPSSRARRAGESLRVRLWPRNRRHPARRPITYAVSAPGCSAGSPPRVPGRFRLRHRRADGARDPAGARFPGGSGRRTAARAARGIPPGRVSREVPAAGPLGGRRAALPGALPRGSDYRAAGRAERRVPGRTPEVPITRPLVRRRRIFPERDSALGYPRSRSRSVQNQRPGRSSALPAAPHCPQAAPGHRRGLRKDQEKYAHPVGMPLPPGPPGARRPAVTP